MASLLLQATMNASACLLLWLLAAGAVAPAPGTAPPLVIKPARVTLRLGEAQQFTAVVEGKPGATITWSLASEGACGTVSPGGYYRAPAQCTTPATIQVVAEAEGDEEGSTLRATATILLAAISVRITPDKTRLMVGQGVTLRANVGQAPDQRVTWQVEGGAENGFITDSGHYASPPRFLTPGRVTVRATSVADPTKGAAATIEIAAIQIEARKKEVALKLGESARLDATVRGTQNASVEWRVLGEGNGDVSPGGVYTTPTQMRTPAVVTVEARSVADPSKTVHTRIQLAAVELAASHGGKKGRKDGLRRRSAPRRILHRVVRLVLPLDPIDLLVPGPWFRGRSGKIYVPVGGVQFFNAEVRNALNDRVLWSVEGGPANGTINEDGIYMAPATMSTPAIVQVRATSAADPSKTQLLMLHVPPILVTGPREAVSVPLGTSRQLSARVENSENDGLVWSVEGGEQFGTITEHGLYVPPPVLTTPAVVNVRATSAADPTKSVALQVRIPEIGISMEDSDVEVRAGQSVRLRARVRGCENAVVNWSVVPEVGKIGPDGVYEAPADSTVQVVQVIATCVADPTKSARATVRIRGE